MSRFNGAPAIIACCALIGILFALLQREPRASAPPVQFTDHTRNAGLVRYAPSFATVATDLDNDGLDDLFVGHHGHPPALFLNRDGRFIEQPLPAPLTGFDDRHAYTFVDLDNDGDRDFIYAGGGADGIGAGSVNRVFRNELVERGSLAFTEASADSDIAYPRWRARVFHPIASPDGTHVDLYLTAIHKRRDESTNLYVTNRSTPGRLALQVARDAPLNARITSDGRDLVFDYDRDGDPDFLSIATERAALYRNNNGRLEHVSSIIDGLRKVRSGAVADFNNDGYPDLYLGATASHSGGDNISSNRDEIHFVVERQARDPEDALSFTATSDTLRFDFVQHIASEGRARVDASDIFIGRGGMHPKQRRGQLTHSEAAGKPADMRSPGTYLWREEDTGTWQVVWRHDEQLPAKSKGIIYGEGISLLGTAGMEERPLDEVQDYLLINRQGRGWHLLAPEQLRHREWTNYLTAADFNNDGLIDIAGVRSRDQGRPNGEPFLLTNQGDLQFTFEHILANAQDDIFRADAIVHGFFNNDGLPDLFFTNGFGLMPGHVGPYQMWLNSTPDPGAHALLVLQGTRSNRDAIGAQVELYNAAGDLLGYREIGPGFGRGQDTLQLHFGLGSYDGALEARVRWPGAADPQSFALAGPGKHILTER